MEKVFQCDYCGKFYPISRATIAWAEADRISDDRILLTVSITCSPFCAVMVNDLRVAR